jgi:uncharacterized protein involved in exopolysaccharide biosynthesis
MELREFLQYIKKYKMLFLGIILAVVGATYVFLTVQPLRYTTVLSLHVARSHSGEQSNEYQYDGFYRLQADEQFADTVVRWLASPRIVSDIYAGAGRDIQIPAEYKLDGVFLAKRLSSQYIEVQFTTTTKMMAENLSRSLDIVLNEKTRALNMNTKDEKMWFRVLVDEPIIYEAHTPWGRVMVGAFFVGVFLALWVVALRVYFSREEEEKD